MAHESSIPKRDVLRPLLFECAWEVANKVGGIYTVIKTKVPVTVSEYGDRYCLIGPLSYKTAPMEVEPIEPFGDPALAETLAVMRDRGVKLLYGRWLVEGSPKVLLFDTGSQYHRLDEWKGDLWNLAGIPTPPHDHETNETIVFGYLVAWFLGEYVSRNLTTAVIAHFHEWQAGLAIPLCRKRHIDLTTVFTTHATLLGRYLCAGSVDFYNNLQYFDVDHEAGKRGIYHRYCIERAAAHCADVFTTVSHITAYESEHLLKRKPDGILPNGLNVVKFAAMHEFQNLHAVSKQKINDFVRGHFYGHYDFDLDNTLYMFTAGRYEYRNKGVDVFIESLARLNHRLKMAGSTVTVVAFIIMPAATHSYTIEALKGQAVTKQLRDTVTEIQNRIGQRIFERAARFPGCRGRERDPGVHGPAVERGPRAAQAAHLRAQAQLAAAGDDAQHGGRRRGPGPQPDPARAALQRRGGPREGHLPPGLPQRQQPDPRARLRGVCARVPPRRVPELLRAVGVHTRGVHGYGHTEHHDESVGLWVVHAGPDREPTRGGVLHRRPAHAVARGLGQPAHGLHALVLPQDAPAAHQPAQPRRAALAAARLEEPRHRVLQGAPARAAARVPGRLRRRGRRGRGRGRRRRVRRHGAPAVLDARQPAPARRRDARRHRHAHGGDAGARHERLPRDADVACARRGRRLSLPAGAQGPQPRGECALRREHPRRDEPLVERGRSGARGRGAEQPFGGAWEWAQQIARTRKRAARSAGRQAVRADAWQANARPDWCGWA